MQRKKPWGRQDRGNCRDMWTIKLIQARQQKNRWNLDDLENMYVEGKCARDVTRKEEAVVKEASEPSSQSGISRYKLGKVVSSAIGRFLEV